MHKSRALHDYLKDRARELTEEWYNSIDKSTASGVYASNDPEVIETLKQQNFDFHLHLIKLFVEDEVTFFQNFDEWILRIARDGEHQSTPIHLIVAEFTRVRTQYLQYIKEFFRENKDAVSYDEYDLWNKVIVKAFDSVVLKYIEETHKFSYRQLKAQQEMINELSSPVISLNNNHALLPLVGDIDTARAKFILESTLNQCAERGVSKLYIDLSGVVMVDTMVAHQIFQLIDALRMIGVETTISGIRPEIALTAMQLGLSFDNITIKSTLSQALSGAEQ
ncbi:STAS domain-containing protein [Bacillus lacus]|uniref:STAS domain-containing protein n=1 Tax=Metabacillus lacus TaxID=1983721 RepID=A0A7X2LZK3_9BACI|nr:STAS domain-containing protein [Metabacillus lacus]MRX73521.1 STAS domain-containing protein [Metabacillus lacus]